MSMVMEWTHATQYLRLHLLCQSATVVLKFFLNAKCHLHTLFVFFLIKMYRPFYWTFFITCSKLLHRSYKKL